MEIWYSYNGLPYTGNCPPYYDLAGKAWFDEINNSIPLIREKILDLLNQDSHSLKIYFGQELVEHGKWKAGAFLIWGKKDRLLKTEKGRAVFRLFKNSPGLVSLSISVLQAHTIINPHYGDTDATYRIHIPIYIPAGLPVCGLRVGGIDKPWKMDEAIAFSDANLHEAWNLTEEDRIILIADVIREEYRSKTRHVCVNVLALLSLQKILGIYGIAPSKYSSSYLPSIMLPLLKLAMRIWLLVN